MRDSLHHPYAHWMSLLVVLTQCPTVHCKSKGKNRHTMVKLQPSDGWQMWDCSHNVPTTILEVQYELHSWFWTHCDYWFRCACTQNYFIWIWSTKKTTIIGSIQLYVGVTESQEERHFQVVMSNAALVADQTIHTSSVCMATSHVQGRLRNTPDPLCFHTTWAIKRVEWRNGNEHTRIFGQTPPHTQAYLPCHISGGSQDARVIQEAAGWEVPRVSL